jgi:hypothetical protein
MASTKRTLGIIGASALMLGFFLPVISFLGFIGLSYFDLLTKVSARFATGLLLLALGGLSLFLALKNSFKPLIGAGILALAVLLFDFITYKKFLANYAPFGQTGTTVSSGTGTSGPGSIGTTGQVGQNAEDLLGLIIQPSWGMFIMAVGAILLIVSGALTDKRHPDGPDWNRNPPPPINYT